MTPNKKLLLCARVLGQLDRIKADVYRLEESIQKVQHSVQYHDEEWEEGALNAVCVQVLSLTPTDLQALKSKVDEAHKALEVYVVDLEKKLAAPT